MSNGVEKINEIVRPLVDSFGVKLDYIEYITQGKIWILRIYIDKEGGITLDDCKKVSTNLSYVLDAEGIISHPYKLEVSSPGLDRPLRHIEDYKKHKGKLAKVNTTKFYDNKNTFIGRIVSVEDEVINIAIDKYGVVGILFSDIANARLEVEF